jgi:hypothetical protein
MTEEAGANFRPLEENEGILLETLLDHHPSNWNQRPLA